MKHFFSILFLILLLFSCKKHDSNQNVIHIKVDDTKKVNFSAIFNEYEFIFPESRDSAWIGLLIRKMEKINGKIFLYNLTSVGSNVLCFDTKGKFLFNIDRLGNGPKEYTLLKDFMIDKQLNMLVLDVIGNQYGSNEYMYFDLDGKYLYSKRRQDIIGSTSSMLEYDENLYVANVYCAQIDNCNDIIFLDRQNLDVIKSFNYVDKFTGEHTPSQSLCKTSNSLLYYGGNDTIYTLSIENNANLTTYFVDFGFQKQKYFKSITDKSHDEILTLARNSFQNKTRRTVNHLFSNNKYLAINYSENKIVDTKNNLCYQTVFYDKETNNSYNTNNINFDIFNFVKNERMEIIGCSDGFFYAILNCPFTKDEIAKIIESTFLSDETRQSFLKMDEESNPIIFVFK